MTVWSSPYWTRIGSAAQTLFGSLTSSCKSCVAPIKADQHSGTAHPYVSEFLKEMEADCGNFPPPSLFEAVRTQSGDSLCRLQATQEHRDNMANVVTLLLRAASFCFNALINTISYGTD